MAEVICGEQEASCYCGLTPGHDGPHECANSDTCNGSWDYDENGNFKVVRLPGAEGLGGVIGSLLGGLF